MDLERDFSRWIECRDEAALTRVFDGTAGRLLLLASHLGGSTASPEDLLQATFLAALRRSGTWDSARPLLPWLVAILQNEARMAGRTRRRRREVGLEQAAATTSTMPDPAGLAADAEAADALAAAVDELPLAYRQTLRLRLVHGMSTAEIAHALERPVGTVRAQLSRGAEMLRRGLPAGLAPAALAWLAGEEALLAAVRTTVLNEAGRFAAATAGAAPVAASAAVTTGGWIMKWNVSRLVAGAVACLLLWAVGFFFLGDSSKEPRPRAGQASRVASVQQTSGATADDSVQPEDPGRRAAEPDSPAEDAALWPLTVTVLHLGEPVPGAGIELWLGPVGVPAERQLPGSLLRTDIERGETDSDGVFRCSLDDLRASSRLLRASSLVFAEATLPGGGMRCGVRKLPAQDEAAPLEITVDFGGDACVTGLVVDAAGQPIAGAQIYEMFEFSRTVGGSDARSSRDGRFVLPVNQNSFDEQEWSWPDRLVVSAAEHGSLELRVDPAAAVEGTRLDVGRIELKDVSAIRGTVRLVDGTPLGDYPLTVVQVAPELAGDTDALRMWSPGKQPPIELRDGQRPLLQHASLRTLADGSFRCAGLDPEASYTVFIRDSLHRITPQAARVGDRVVLEVDAQLLSLSVESAQSDALVGVPVRADCFDPKRDNKSWSARPGFPERGQILGGGFFEVDASGHRVVLSPFGVTWCFYTTSEAAIAEPLRHEVLAGAYYARRTFVVEQSHGFGSLRLVVADESGQPTDQFGLRLKHRSRDVSRNLERTVPPEDHTYHELPAGDWDLEVLLGRQLPNMFAHGTPARGTENRVIHIEAGKTTDVRVESSPAGRVAFRLHSTKPPTAAWWPEVKIFDLGSGDLLQCARHCDDPTQEHWPLDQQFLLADDAFAPGEHRFRVLVAGYAPAECEVEVADGRLVSARVELIPE